MASKTRKATHAGSWYSARGSELDLQLQRWLDAAIADAPEPTEGFVRGIIAPHAGYSYSGPTAAHAYKNVNAPGIKRVFVLGPSHHLHLRGCALTAFGAYQTPLGALTVDPAVQEELRATGAFETMSREVDEDEHSLELQCPFIAKTVPGATIVPVLVGSLSPDRERSYGAIFARYLSDPANLFVISSDFCHWGDRFRYTYYDPSHGQICESIERVDRLGMRSIETLSPDAYRAYQQQYENTICGRHAITVLLHALQASPQPASSSRKLSAAVAAAAAGEGSLW
eukprot:CAMPEP_0172179206 /NCGR_PEP_ID=MMETSP1050-20130122/16483_1 /TAXON_ID=233186 /ORGANISM="Cryptomonas curvata, Strain CCAP979/52" /LENGTH=283 /DNA_ID=CAMNT_0012852051 /DNA_START=9 /DNA_END=857 /DNA_ORIENTATION=-